MEQKKKDQDVLIVRDEQTGEIGVVAGLKSDGTPNLRPAKAEHAQDFLRFDRHGDVLDNFFANFFRQCKEPNRFGFYRVAVEGMENVVAVMKDLLKDPVGFRDVLAPHKVDTTKYEQAAAQQVQETPPEPEKEEKQQDEKYQPIDETQVDSEAFERLWGVKVEDLRQAGCWERMLGHGKSPLVTCYPEIGGIRFPVEARLSLRENPDGTVSLVPHPLHREPNLKSYKNIEFTDEDRKSLKKTGNLGRVAEVLDKNTGELVPSYISIDRQTNETIAVPVSVLRIPDEVKGVKLDKEQQEALAAGKGVYLEGMTSKSGKPFNATIQINADKQGLDFHFGGHRQAQRNGQQNGQTPDDGRKVYIGKTLLGLPILDEMRQGWAQNKWVLMEGLTDKKGRTFNAYVRPNHEKGKYDFRRTIADKSQIYEINPAHASETQVAINSDGKTNEATKHVGEPLKKGQTAPADTKQQEQQEQGENRRQHTRKRSGMKM
ncbi:DUF3945 domain-containing protein [uncultured Alistipes sp.]|uniref:DUF3945 domain-containing protein n=1 Tax=uncultured Alistipes sp. TaxID=538949 RepID=UPI002593EBAC|nr:DUF3945 domain-containing protein [uncultured Alistipes sp.]